MGSIAVIWILVIQSVSYSNLATVAKYETQEQCEEVARMVEDLPGIRRGYCIVAPAFIGGGRQ